MVSRGMYEREGTLQDRANGECQSVFEAIFVFLVGLGTGFESTRKLFTQLYIDNQKIIPECPIF